LEVVFVDISGDRDVNREMAEAIRARAVRERDIAYQYLPLAPESGRTVVRGV